MDKVEIALNKNTSDPFSVKWNLSEFRDFLQEGLQYGCFHFFLIKKTGVRLLVRESDYLPSSDLRKDVRQKVIHAIGLNREVAISDESQADKIKNTSDELCVSDVCEWFSLSTELLSEVEERLAEDFREIQFTFTKFEYDDQRFDEYTLASLKSGELVLSHNVDIDWFGGGCSPTKMIADIEISYIKVGERKCLKQEYGDSSLHIDRFKAESFQRFTAENFPNGFVDDAIDSGSVDDTSEQSQYDQLIQETPESNFINLALEYAESLSNACNQSRATINLITYIAYGSDPETFVEILDEGETLAEAIRRYVEWTTTIEGLKNFVDEQLDDAKDQDCLDEFGIDSSGALDYIDIESFVKDVDLNFVMNAIKDLWNKSSNSPFN